MDEMMKQAYEAGAWEALKDMGFTQEAVPEKTAVEKVTGPEELKALLAKIAGRTAAAELSPLAKILTGK